MVHTLELSRAQARRIAVQAQVLDEPRPDDLLEVLRRLTLLQHDPIAAVAPSADLVLWSRLGEEYAPGGWVEALDRGEIVELRGMLRPAEDMALYLAEMAAWPGPDAPEYLAAQARWVEANRAGREAVLEALRADGPLPQSELPDLCEVPWRSSGWNNNKNLTMLLGFLVERGEVAVAGGTGRDRLWDLAERIYPDVDPLPLAEARRRREERRLASLGIARASAPRTPAEPNDVGPVGAEAVVEGVRGRWRVDPRYLDLPFASRVALLSPFDRLVYDRRRVLELFDFDYQLEMYKPAATRRWGYYALPILYGDRLVGKLDSKVDERAGVLRVHAIHEDEPFDGATRAAVRSEIEALAGWLGLDVEDEARSTR